MVFSSSIFLFVFLPITLILYFNPILKKLKYRNILLLLLSIGFYAWGEPVFVFIMIFSVFINWLLGLAIEKYWDKRKIFTIIATAYNILLLFIFKYLTFITENIAWISGNDSIIVNIALPIGISFFTFQMMSYIFDIVMRKAKPQKNFFNVLLYISMFPQLIAGPIVRYETIEKEINDRTSTIDDFSIGMCRFIKGLGKKVLIANTISLLVDTIFQYDIANLSVAVAWLGAIGYTLQIYFDFSGYSDMAIGLGRIFGFHFLENFEHPYQSKSVSEFWRRWHISMGTWFRDYVYFPLGGSRVSKYRHILNLFIVWFLTGLWHGANWTFIIWGLMYFVILVVEKITKLDKKIDKMGHLWTMFFVIIGWVLFRSNTIQYAISYIGTMFAIKGNGIIDIAFFDLLKQYWIIIVVGIIFSLINVNKLGYKFEQKSKLYNILYTVTYLAIFFLSICAVTKGGNDPFIYFNF